MSWETAASSDAVNEAQEQRAFLRRRRRDADLQTVLGTEAGRRVLWGIMADDLGLYYAGVPGDVAAGALRNAALSLRADIMQTEKINPLALLHQMERECEEPPPEGEE